MKETAEDIAKELLKTIQYIPEEGRQSKWYQEYLNKVNSDLIKLHIK